MSHEELMLTVNATASGVQRHEGAAADGITAPSTT